MTAIQEFKGSVLSNTSAHLGEGPSFDAATNTAYWFSILDSELHELSLDTNQLTVHKLPFMASVLARVDDERQIIMSENGLYIREKASGALSLVTPIEHDRPDMRSNDGRVHPSGALWCSTMKKGHEGRRGAGSIYHVAQSTVTRLFEGVSIPNGICFSPDGAVGYYVDTMENRYMRVPLDPMTGLPTGEAQIFSDEAGVEGGIDGSVCDADGYIWNARWGVGQLRRYSPNGEVVGIYAVPASQTTCPAFIGRDADRLLVTTAREDMSAEDRAADPSAGLVFELGVKVKGVADVSFKL
jgi:sugar lactone lactonase YvrE